MKYIWRYLKMCFNATYTSIWGILNHWKAVKGVKNEN